MNAQGTGPYHMGNTAQAVRAQKPAMIVRSCVATVHVCNLHDLECISESAMKLSTQSTYVDILTILLQALMLPNTDTSRYINYN